MLQGLALVIFPQLDFTGDYEFRQAFENDCAIESREADLLS